MLFFFEYILTCSIHELRFKVPPFINMLAFSPIPVNILAIGFKLRM